MVKNNASYTVGNCKTRPLADLGMFFHALFEARYIYKKVCDTK